MGSVHVKTVDPVTFTWYVQRNEIDYLKNENFTHNNYAQPNVLPPRTLLNNDLDFFTVQIITDFCERNNINILSKIWAATEFLSVVISSMS